MIIDVWFIAVIQNLKKTANSFFVFLLFSIFQQYLCNI